jgi:hypothetical protein
MAIILVHEVTGPVFHILIDHLTSTSIHLASRCLSGSLKATSADHAFRARHLLFCQLNDSGQQQALQLVLNSFKPCFSLACGLTTVWA